MNLSTVGEFGTAPMDCVKGSEQELKKKIAESWEDEVGVK